MQGGAEHEESRLSPVGKDDGDGGSLNSGAIPDR